MGPGQKGGGGSVPPFRFLQNERGPVIYDSIFWSRRDIEKSGVFLNARRICYAKITFFSREMSCTGFIFFFKRKFMVWGKSQRWDRPPPPHHYDAVSWLRAKGGGSPPPGLCVYRRREEVYHYTRVCGGCVGTTYMGSPRVGSYTLWYSCSFFLKKRVFRVFLGFQGKFWCPLGPLPRPRTLSMLLWPKNVYFDPFEGEGVMPRPRRWPPAET